jgi:hypothetical protein
MKKFIALAFLVVQAMTAFAQDITPQEMMQLDKMRSQYKAQGIEVTPEQEARMLQTMRALRGLTHGLSSTAAASGSAPATSILPTPAQIPMQTTQISAPMSEADMAQKISELPKPDKLPTIEMVREGLQYDGKRFVDQQGRIDNATIDMTTGSIGYTVRTTTPNTVSIKIAKLVDTAVPIEIGKLVRDRDTVFFESVTGTKLSGSQYFPTSSGVVLIRDGVGFAYTAGKGVTQHQYPKGWNPAPIQRGNVSGTGWLLLEKDKADEKDNPIKGIFNKAVGISNMLGITDGAGQGDYALFDMKTGKLKIFEITDTGKNIYTGINCKRQNELVNRCDSFVGTESLWDKDGSPNNGHYFWRINWQSTNGTAVAVVLENGVKKVNAYDLNQDKMINLFNRTLGITGLQVLASPERLKVSAKLGFTTETVDDVLAAFAKSEATK